MNLRGAKAVPVFLSVVVSFGLLGASTPSPIDSAYNKLGGVSSGLGKPLGGETCGLRDGGCYRNFQYGAIVWSPENGAQPSLGAIRSAWADDGFEKGALGYPTDSPACGDGSCTQHYEVGAISWSADEGISVSHAVDDPASIAVVVNKQRPLNPVSYAPVDLVTVDGQQLRADAAQSLLQLKAAAASEGVPVAAISGYRSSETQAVLYGNYSAQYGQNVADTISARPGYSEHQTGLAVDIAAPDGTCSLQGCFEDTAAGSWTAANAYRFGFIIRYPEDAADITGYAYEPWHLRFVGIDMARSMHDQPLGTLEEYLRLPAAGNY